MISSKVSRKFKSQLLVRHNEHLLENYHFFLSLSQNRLHVADTRHVSSTLKDRWGWADLTHTGFVLLFCATHQHINRPPCYILLLCRMRPEALQSKPALSGSLCHANPPLPMKLEARNAQGWLQGSLMQGLHPSGQSPAGSHLQDFVTAA